MKAIILAAGKGKRMYPLTKDKPKALLEVDGKTTILDLLVDRFEKVHEIDEIIVVTNSKYDTVFREWGANRNIKFITSDEEGNVIVCLINVIKKLKLTKYDIFVAASDNVLSFELQSFVDFYSESQETVSVMYHKESRISELQKTGVANIKDGVVIDMQEKPIEPIYDCAIPPFYILPESKLRYLKLFFESRKEIDSLGDFLSWYVKREKVRAFPMPGKRFNLGDLQAYTNYLTKTE